MRIQIEIPARGVCSGGCPLHTGGSWGQDLVDLPRGQSRDPETPSQRNQRKDDGAVCVCVSVCV